MFTLDSDTPVRNPIKRPKRHVLKRQQLKKPMMRTAQLSKDDYKKLIMHSLEEEDYEANTAAELFPKISETVIDLTDQTVVDEKSFRERLAPTPSDRVKT